jgi:hypothetical protein
MEQIQNILNFIPSGITLFIFFIFLKTNKDIKRIRFAAGSARVEYETKDAAAPADGMERGKNDAQDRAIDGISGKLEKLKSLIEKSVTDIKKRDAELDVRLDKQYEYVREAALKSCTAIVFSETAPLIEFFDAAFLSLYMGANGNTTDMVIKKIIKSKDNLSIYKSELARFRKAHKNENKHFDAAIEDIHKEWH